MTRTLDDCTAHDLATGNVDTLPADETVSTARAWFADRGYDAAPVVDGGQPVGSVEHDALSDATDDDTVGDHARPITLDALISADATFGELLDALYDRPYYYLGGRNRVTGVLTRADLNTPPAYIHLYDRLTVLEASFRDAILTHAPDWKERDALGVHPDAIDEIETRHQQAQHANIDLAEIHYAQFSTLTAIVTAVEECWRAFGFTSDTVAARELADVTEIRNAVAHSNLLVQNTAGGLGSGRTVGTVLDAYETLQQCIDARGPDDG